MNNDCEDFPQHLEKFFSNAEEIIYHGIKCSFLLKESTTEMFYLYKVTSATDTKTNKKPNNFPNTTSKWAYQTWFSLECSYFFIFWTRMLSQSLFKKNKFQFEDTLHSPLLPAPILPHLNFSISWKPLNSPLLSVAPIIYSGSRPLVKLLAQAESLFFYDLLSPGSLSDIFFTSFLRVKKCFN